MIKMVCMFNRKPGLTMAEFRYYYENNHVPLVTGLLSNWCDYRRNYRIEDSGYEAPHGDPTRTNDAVFDVMTEITYESEAKYQATMAALADPEVGKRVAEDEAKFMDRPSMRVHLVEECQSPQ